MCRKVRITQCSEPSLWYLNSIGCSFPLVGSSYQYYHVETEQGTDVVFRDDGAIDDEQGGVDSPPPADTEETPIRERGVPCTLRERGARYGEFTGHARITQNLKKSMVDSPNWSELSPDKKEALEMIVHKIGRILNGDPNYSDNWHDIQGYAGLIEDELDA